MDLNEIKERMRTQKLYYCTDERVLSEQMEPVEYAL